MKSKISRTLVLISVFIAILTINLGFIFTNMSISKATNQITFLEGLHISATYNSTIVIDDTNPVSDWATAKAAGYCTGTGTSGDPYIISNDLFNVTTWGYCLQIMHSRKYFRVLDSEFMNSGVGSMFLFNTSNGLVQGNQMPGFIFGIDVNNCSDITFRSNNCSLGTLGFLVQNSRSLIFDSNIVL